MLHCQHRQCIVMLKVPNRGPAMTACHHQLQPEWCKVVKLEYKSLLQVATDVGSMVAW